jgi:hypothetical protein
MAAMAQSLACSQLPMSGTSPKRSRDPKWLADQSTRPDRGDGRTLELDKAGRRPAVAAFAGSRCFGARRAASSEPHSR